MEIKIPKVYMRHFRVHGDFVCYNLLIFPTGTKRRGLSSSHSDLGWRRGEDTLMLRPVTIECTGA